eukprot:jgi/Botrbrau1/6237/Bobra.0109s0032.1
MLELKYKHGETDACLEDICRLMHHCKLPRPNIHPPSLHLCMRVAECRDFKATMKHVCGGGCTAFSTLAPSDYANHLQDTCIECGGLRIVQEKLGVKTNLRPARVVYDLGVGNAIQQLFHDEEFCKMRGSGRDTQGDYYQSPEASRLHAAAMADIKDKDTSVYELGMDYFQPFQNSNYSVGLVIIRCLDIPSLQRSKLRFSQVVAVISGPREPQLIKGCISGILQELQTYRTGFRVTEHRTVDGRHQTRTFMHKVILSGGAGDTPVIRKYTRWCGHSAILGCGRCL